jgi:hypothetical protein
MTEKTLTDLLIRKYSKDYICIPQCKTGSTWHSRYKTLDMWAMAKSFENMHAIGFEIKVDRNDFLKDEKWHAYLEYCNRFYFVCPKGLIDPNELPIDAGLLEASKNARLLYERKKSPERELKIPDSLYQYVIMNRNDYMTRGRIEYYEAYVKDRRNGSFVGFQIKEIIQKKMQDVRDDNRMLRNENYSLKHIKDFLDSIGIDYQDSRQAIREIKGKNVASRDVLNLIKELAEKTGILK